MFSHTEREVRSLLSTVRAAAVNGDDYRVAVVGRIECPIVVETFLEVLELHELDNQGYCARCSRAGSVWDRLMRRRVHCREYLTALRGLNVVLDEEAGAHAVRTAQHMTSAR
ncbi:hypothetical protein [Crossiella sp. CA198]|uniref:hypothetical protein n=1 Tax=Crossiella sp. CA198 TaxID=3455607 RepID=UPI003F8D05E5